MRRKSITFDLNFPVHLLIQHMTHGIRIIRKIIDSPGMDRVQITGQWHRNRILQGNMMTVLMEIMVSHFKPQFKFIEIHIHIILKQYTKI